MTHPNQPTTPRDVALQGHLQRSRLSWIRGGKCSLGGICLVASAVAHALVLRLPLLEATSQTLDSPPSEAVPAAIVTSVLPRPPVSALDIPEAVEPTPLPAPPVTASPPIPEVLAPPVVVTPAETQPPMDITPPPSPPEAPLPEPHTSEPPEPQALEPPTSEPQTSEPLESDPDPYGDFPHLAGATANCGDRANCWRTPTNNWRAARGSLQAQLEAQGYILTDVTSAVLGIDTGVQVYTVTRPGEEDYYLSLVSVQDGVLYTMAPHPITRDELATLQSL